MHTGIVGNLDRAAWMVQCMHQSEKGCGTGSSHQFIAAAVSVSKGCGCVARFTLRLQCTGTQTLMSHES